MREFSLKQGADVSAKDDKGRTPLHRVAMESVGIDQTRMMTLLIQSGADIHERDNNGETPLHTAMCLPVSSWGRHWHSEDERKAIQRSLWKLEAASVLLKAGGVVDATNDKGQMPLHMAVERRDVGSTFFLIDFRCGHSRKNQ